MNQYMIFQVYGPMASWGETAVGEYRPSSPRPTRSAVFGLLAAALGIDRNRDVEILALERGYWFAVHVEQPGTLLRDYHTIQTCTTPGRTAARFASRSAELDRPRHKLNTMISLRDYRADSLALVCLWPRAPQPAVSLEQLQQALRTPVFTLYLGRKSCPPGLPLAPTLIEAEDLVAALKRFRSAQSNIVPGSLYRAEPELYWDADAPVEQEAAHQVTRRDRVLSRMRWQFSSRVENYAVVTMGLPREEDQECG